MINQPAPFALTESEAVRVQQHQSLRQAQFARKGRMQRIASVVVPVFALAVLFATEWFVYDGAMPGDLFFGVIIAYLFGLFSQILLMKLFIADTKSRMLQSVPQVWETRHITLDDSGVHHLSDTSKTTYAWSSISEIENKDNILFLWIHAFSAIVIPHRAFATSQDVTAFEAEARRLAKP